MTSEPKAPERIWAWPHGIGIHEGFGEWKPDGCTLKGDEIEYIRADAAQAMVAGAYAAAAYRVWLDNFETAEEASEQIRALTPADASAALTERDNATWNSAIEAAMGVRLTYLVDSEANPTGKIVRRPAEDIARAIAALKREKP